MPCNVQTSQRIPTSPQNSNRLAPQQTQEPVEKISWGTEPCQPLAFVCEVGTVAHLLQIRKESSKEPRGLCPRPGPFGNPQEALAGIFGIGKGFWSVQSLKEYISHTCMNMYKHPLTHTQVFMYAHTDTHSSTGFRKQQFVGLRAALHMQN